MLNKYFFMFCYFEFASVYCTDFCIDCLFSVPFIYPSIHFQYALHPVLRVARSFYIVIRNFFVNIFIYLCFSLLLFLYLYFCLVECKWFAVIFFLHIPNKICWNPFCAICLLFLEIQQSPPFLPFVPSSWLWAVAGALLGVIALCDVTQRAVIPQPGPFKVNDST